MDDDYFVVVRPVPGDVRMLISDATYADEDFAKNQAVTNVDRTIRSVKRHIGTDWAKTTNHQ